MSDSIPPPSPWGIPPYDERDLDALLSGEVTDIPVALRPLADALTALKGPATPDDLRGEAAIMAEFRAQAEFGARGPASASAGRRVETLELPTLQPDSRQRRAARHRVRRPANRRLSAFLVAGVAAAIVGAVAFTGNLPGPIQRLAHLSTATPRAASPTAVRPTSPNLQDRSASSERAVPHKKRARPSPSPSLSGSASTLCRTFFSYVEHPVGGQQWWNSSTYSQLSAKAGGPDHILGFCLPYLRDMFPHGMPAQFPDFSAPGQQGPGNGYQGGASSSGQGSSNGNMVPGRNAYYPAQGS